MTSAVREPRNAWKANDTIAGLLAPPLSLTGETTTNAQTEGAMTSSLLNFPLLLLCIRFIILGQEASYHCYSRRRSSCCQCRICSSASCLEFLFSSPTSSPPTTIACYGFYYPHSCIHFDRTHITHHCLLGISTADLISSTVMVSHS